MQTSHERYCKSSKEQEIKIDLLKVAAIFYFTMAAAICYLKFHRRMRMFDLNLDPFGYTNDENNGLYLFDWCDEDCIFGLEKFMIVHGLYDDALRFQEEFMPLIFKAVQAVVLEDELSHSISSTICDHIL
jgi:hypothetical protein